MQYQLLALALVAAVYAAPQAPSAPVPIATPYPFASGPRAPSGPTGTGVPPPPNGTAIVPILPPPPPRVGSNGTALPTGAPLLPSGGLLPPGNTTTTGVSTASITNGAMMPTALVGFAFAGAAGVAGLLVL